jgi:hypothetical protein
MALPAPATVAPCQNLDRLPRGDDRTIGAGYAMGMAAAGAAALYFVVQFVGTLLLSTVVGSGLSGLFLGVAAIGLLSGAVTVAGVVAPVAFVAGVVAWRSVPPSVPFVGAVSGLLATMLVYVGPALIGICGAAVLTVLTGGVIAEAVVGVAAFAGFAFVATCWITLPLGILAGTLYERSRSPDE